MKALPFKNVEGSYTPCAPAEATHLQIHLPGPTGRLLIPVMLHGKREGTPNWTWNGDTEKPTLRPSLLTTGHDFRCHCWVNDGQAQFLSDSTHEFANQNVPLCDVDF